MCDVHFEPVHYLRLLERKPGGLAPIPNFQMRPSLLDQEICDYPGFCSLEQSATEEQVSARGETRAIA